VPFGSSKSNLPGDRKPLLKTGAYFEALQGRGAGSVEVVTAKTVRVGVDLAAFPFAGFIRGGTGADIRTSPLLILPRKRVAGWQPLTKRGKPRAPQTQWALWYYLGLTFGVWLSAETMVRGLKLPPRPHLTRNPLLVRQVVRLYEKFWTSGALDGGADA
jgi:hypothetical protein